MRTKERDKGQYYDRVNLVDSLYILGQLDIHTINTDINTGYKYYKYYTYVMYTYIYKYINTRGQFDVGYKLVNYQVDRRKEKKREDFLRMNGNKRVERVVSVQAYRFYTNRGISMLFDVFVMSNSLYTVLYNIN